MEENILFVSAIRDLIEKVKKQDSKFGQYLEGNTVLDHLTGEISYTGRPIDQLPHLPIYLKE